MCNNNKKKGKKQTKNLTLYPLYSQQLELHGLFSLGSAAAQLWEVRGIPWDAAPPAPLPRCRASLGAKHLSSATALQWVNDPQTKNTLSRGLDIIDSNVLKGAIRYRWVNDTHLEKKKKKKVRDCVFTRLGAFIPYSVGSLPRLQLYAARATHHLPLQPCHLHVATDGSCTGHFLPKQA